jgi:hypothetical protein
LSVVQFPSPELKEQVWAVIEALDSGTRDPGEIIRPGGTPSVLGGRSAARSTVTPTAKAPVFLPQLPASHEATLGYYAERAIREELPFEAFASAHSTSSTTRVVTDLPRRKRNVSVSLRTVICRLIVSSCSLPTHCWPTGSGN